MECAQYRGGYHAKCKVTVKPAFKKLTYKKLQAEIVSIRYLNIRN